MLFTLEQSCWHWIILTAVIELSFECFDLQCISGHLTAQAFKVKPHDIVLSHVSFRGLILVALDSDWASVPLLSYITPLFIEWACSKGWLDFTITSNPHSEASFRFGLDSDSRNGGGCYTGCGEEFHFYNFNVQTDHR